MITVMPIETGKARTNAAQQTRCDHHDAIGRKIDIPHGAERVEQRLQAMDLNRERNIDAVIPIHRDRMCSHGRSRLSNARLSAVVLLPFAATACKDERNRYVAPPPPKVSVATPVRHDITRYLELNGTVQAANTVDLVARVDGFLREIGYKDGETVGLGTALFTIEPDPYLAKLQQAQAQEAAAQAALTQAQQELSRQSALGQKDFASQSKVDEARKNRDSTDANLRSAQAAVRLAAITYSYTRVLAPFDGVVTRHLASVGELVGGAAVPTRLATIVQLDPIYVTFNVSETDVLRIRTNLAQRSISKLELDKIPVEVGLANEAGYPHVGVLDYIAPDVDPATGTLPVRGIFKNGDHILMPGNFARVRVPTVQEPGALLVPDTALGSDQGGRYLLVVNGDSVVQQKYVEAGQLDGSLRVIDKGLEPDDRVVVDGIQRAVPGTKVDPRTSVAQAAN